MAANLVAFTGGGWNAMSGHSAWIGAALASGTKIQGQPLTLDQLFLQTESASGNSGGSWFLSMLAYSEQFSEDLRERPNEWFKTGYFGSQKEIFTSAPEQTDYIGLLAEAFTPSLNELVERFSEDALTSYKSNDAFNGLNSFLDDIRNIDLGGISKLAEEISNNLELAGQTVVKDIINVLGLQNLLDSAVKSFLEGKFWTFLEALSALALKPIEDGGTPFDWYDSVKETAFKTYDLNKTLNDLAEEIDRLSWAGNKNILFPITASGYPITINETTSDSFFQSSLQPSSNTTLPADEQYLIPLTARMTPTNQNSESMLVFPEQDLQYSSYVVPEFNEQPLPNREISISFPINIDLTVLEIISASGSFAGVAAIPATLASVISEFVGGIVSDIDTAKELPIKIENYVNQFIDSIKSTGNKFFDDLKHPTNTGDWLVDDANKILNIPINAAEELFDKLVDGLSLNLLSGPAEYIYDLVIKSLDSVVLSTESLTRYIEPVLSEIVRGLALPVDFDRDKVASLPQAAIDINSPSPFAPLRIFDGGFTDNTGVLSVIQQWQEDHPDPDDRFVVNAFINSTDTVDLGVKLESGQSVPVSIDFAKLFGKDGSRLSDSIVQDFPLPTGGSLRAIYPYVFDGSVWDNANHKSPTWSYAISEDFGIAYYKIEVTTVDNPGWGIRAGQKGVINAFTSYNTNSFAGPLDITDQYIWDEYQKNYEEITAAIISNGGDQYLLKALGVLSDREVSGGSKNTDSSIDVAPTPKQPSQSLPATSPSSSITPTPSPESPVIGIQPQALVTMFELAEPLMLGSLQVTRAIVGTPQSDVITGSDEGEAIAGGQGKDRMTGGGGPDLFVFETPDEFGQTKADIIMDFNGSEGDRLTTPSWAFFEADEGDKIVIESDAFYGVRKVRFKSVSGKREITRMGRSKKNFIYNEKNGMLYFNANGKRDDWGNGGEFVKLIGSPEFVKNDLILV